MPRAVFATELQARKALDALSNARITVKGGQTLDDASEKHGMENRPTFSRPTLQRWITHPTPVILKSTSGYYVKVPTIKNHTFFEHEENEPVNRMIAQCQIKGYLEHENVVRLDAELR